jgi:hypothetical protein
MKKTEFAGGPRRVSRRKPPPPTPNKSPTTTSTTMSHSPFRDRRASSLLNRVREDISNLREDIGSLFLHTTKNTVPNSARDLADQAKSQLAAGSAYAADRFRSLRHQPTPHPASWIGGAVVIGLLAVGAYVLIKANCPCEDDYDLIADDDDYQQEDADA